MPIPTPHSNEDKKDFLVRCMSDEVMKSEYTDVEQRYAVCSAQLNEVK